MSHDDGGWQKVDVTQNCIVDIKFASTAITAKPALSKLASNILSKQSNCRLELAFMAMPSEPAVHGSSKSICTVMSQ